jgi:negative regulator of replication initiation
MVDAFDAMTLAALRRLPFAAALCLGLAAAGCQPADLSQQTKKTEAAICSELATVNQALEQVATLTPASTVGEARAAQQTLEQSIAALKTSENQLQKLRVEAFSKVLDGFRGEVAKASANKDQTLEEAANELKPKAMAVIAARKALSAAVQCEEPAAAAPSKP